MINKLFLRWIVLFGLCSTFALSAISADTLPEVDDFNSDTEGWTGANVSWNSSGKRLFINHDNFASKTYDFGVENANQIVSIELKVTEISSWENDDHLQVRVDGTTNGIPVLDETVNGTSEMHTFSAVLDKNGQLKMTITPNTSDNAEDIYIEKITISASANNYSKSYTPDFFLRKQLYAKGNMKMIGNTVLVAPTTQNSSTICTSYTNGSFIPNATNTNDEYYLCGYSVDGNQINATRSELNIPKTSKILWAGLYWQALIKTTDFSTSQTIKIRNDANGSNSYKSISPDRLYYMESGYSSTTAYSAFKDVTSLFTENGWVDGNYTVANIPVYEGKLSNLGTYGAWSLTVIYEDTSEQYRSFSVYDGWDRVSNSRDVTISPSGFYTPNRLLVTAEAKVSLFTAEGDKNIDGDTLETKNYRTNSSVTLPASSNNTFISTISGGGSRTPNAVNNQGIDIQTYEIGDLLEKKQTDMDFTLTSTGDVYWPSVIAFSTVLIAPELCYDYSFKQNGAYLKASNTGNQLPLLSGYISDAALETTIYIRNKDADILAQGLSFYTDVNTSMFNYINNSVETSNVNGSILIPRIPDATASCNYTTAGTTNIGCDSGADIRIGLGNGATGYGQYEGGSLSNKEFVYAKFSMDPVGVNRIADINQSLGLKLNYYIVPKTGATPIPYDYTFGDEIKLCPPSSGYAPTWGTFNVVDRNAPTYGAYSLPINNLHTQVSRKPFDVDVAAYGDDGSKTYNIRPTADINTTVLVEMIDNDAFHDANASCANPDSNVSQAIYVPLTITGGLTGDMTDLVVTQDIAYYNFAVKNAAFRIWYFVDSNESLIQNWTATTSDTTRRNLTGISGLYNNSAYPLCASSCTTPTSTTCFSCIRANYARPLCSRDNFAVRPEAYDIHIFDINQSLLQTDPLKDSTKIKLADSIVTANRLKVAAGYNYRYDMNATGNDDLQKVPGYTRYFNGANSDYNATLVWEPTTIKTGCNDTAGKTLSFYIANGQMTNAEQNLTQVGEYRLSVVDPAWTAVDWLYLNHHSVASGFSTGEDCIVNNTTTDPTTDPSALKRIGCLTSSSHTGGGYTYTDHLMTFKPAKFDLSAITYGIGILPTSIAAGGSGYVYTSNLGAVNDMGMSVRSYGAVKAEGYSGETLSNFVKDCYASDLNVTISHDANNSYAPFVGRMTVSDLNGTQLYDSLEFNAKSAVSMTIDDSNFTKADMGTTVPTIRLNFDRNVTTPLEPQIVHYDDLNVSCLIASDCNMSAAYNITPNTAFSSDAMDFNVTHIYGRLIPRDTKVMGLIPFDVVAKYEAYKTPMLLGNALAADSFQADWNVNALHTEANYGNADISFVLPTAGSVLPSTTIYDNNGTVTYHFNAYSIRQGYKGHINTGGWLWYGGTSALDYVIPSNPSNVDCLTHPCFNISFGRIIGNTGSAKTESEAQKANKNTSSGTGWHSTSEYAPATR